jgi:hypothetical protein
VVTVSSNAQAMGRIDFDDLQGERFQPRDAVFGIGKGALAESTLRPVPTHKGRRWHASLGHTLQPATPAPTPPSPLRSI